MSEVTEAKARLYLAEGRIKVEHVVGDYGVFLAQGSGDKPYTIRYVGSVWQCSCPAQKVQCAHVIACMLLTDFNASPKLGDDGELDELLGGPSQRQEPEDWTNFEEDVDN